MAQWPAVVPFPKFRRSEFINYENQTRRCTKCGEWKEWKFFTTQGGKPFPHSRCYACGLQMHRDKKAKNPELYRATQRRNDYRTKYGISIEEYEEMLKQQGFGCKICKSKRSGRKSGVFLVDHDHATGKVRGLLCARCNVGLGNFNDDPDQLRRAAQYVETGGVS